MLYARSKRRPEHPESFSPTHKNKSIAIWCHLEKNVFIFSACGLFYAIHINLDVVKSSVKPPVHNLKSYKRVSCIWKPLCVFYYLFTVITYEVNKMKPYIMESISSSIRPSSFNGHNLKKRFPFNHRIK